MDYPIYQSSPQCPLYGVHNPCGAVSKGSAAHCTEVHLCGWLRKTETAPPGNIGKTWKKTDGHIQKTHGSLGF